MNAMTTETFMDFPPSLRYPHKVRSLDAADRSFWPKELTSLSTRCLVAALGRICGSATSRGGSDHGITSQLYNCSSHRTLVELGADVRWVVAISSVLKVTLRQQPSLANGDVDNLKVFLFTHGRVRPLVLVVYPAGTCLA